MGSVGGGGGIGVVAAVVTASTAVVVAVLGVVSSWVLDGHRRRYDRRRAALLDVQETALRVRRGLADAGEDLHHAVDGVVSGSSVELREDPRATRERSQAEAVLEVHLSRVESEAVRDAVAGWHRTARFALISQGDDEVTVADEECAWRQAHELVAAQLADPGWWADRGRRRAERRRLSQRRG